MIAEALASDNKTFGAIAITITAGTPAAWLAYTDNSDGKYAQHVYSLDLNNWDMNHPVQYEANTAAGNSLDLWAAISPDGTQVAYIENSPAGETILTAPIEGGAATTVKSWNAPGFGLFGVTYRRDGSGDFFVTYEDPSTGVCGVATLSKDGSSWTPHTATNIACGGESFSNPPITPAALADGSVVYSARGPNGNAQIFKLNSDLKTVTNLSNNQFNDYSLSLSPDKLSQLVFASDRGGTVGLYIMNADGTNVSSKPIVTSGQSPAWCSKASGDVVVYVDGNANLFSIPSAGGNPTQITNWTSFSPACE